MFKPNSNITTSMEINYFIDSSIKAYTNQEKLAQDSGDKFKIKVT